jgi:hypothetical protein
MWLSAGLCRAALLPLKAAFKGIREKMQCILVLFLEKLSDQSRSVAVAVLVAGNAVESTVRYMAEEGLDVDGFGLRLLLQFISSSVGRQRLFADGVADQLLKGIAKWLLQVCDALPSCRT